MQMIAWVLHGCTWIIKKTAPSAIWTKIQVVRSGMSNQRGLCDVTRCCTCPVLGCTALAWWWPALFCPTTKWQRRAWNMDGSMDECFAFRRASQTLNSCNFSSLIVFLLLKFQNSIVYSFLHSLTPVTYICSPNCPEWLPYQPKGKPFTMQKMEKIMSRERKQVLPHWAQF